MIVDENKSWKALIKLVCKVFRETEGQILVFLNTK